MKILKKIVAAVVAAASISAIGVTASADPVPLPTNWIAVRQQGAPASVNKTYTYDVFTYGGGYDISCTFFIGDYDRNVLVKKIFDVYLGDEKVHVDAPVANLHAKTQSPIYVEHLNVTIGNYITFTFLANSFYNCNANGVISEHK